MAHCDLNYFVQYTTYALYTFKKQRTYARGTSICSQIPRFLTQKFEPNSTQPNPRINPTTPVSDRTHIAEAYLTK